jgi:Methyltransferase domain
MNEGRTLVYSMSKNNFKILCHASTMMMGPRWLRRRLLVCTKFSAFYFMAFATQQIIIKGINGFSNSLPVSGRQKVHNIRSDIREPSSPSAGAFHHDRHLSTVVSLSTSNAVAGHDENEQGHRCQPLVEDFVRHLCESIQQRSFVSLTLHGVKKPKDRNREESVRGCIRQVQGRLITISTNHKKSKKQQELLLQLTFKYHLATDICKNIPIESVESELSKILLFSQEKKDNELASDGDDSAVIASEWGAEAIQSQPLRRADLITTGNPPTLWELQLVGKSKPSLKKRTVQQGHPSLPAANEATNSKSKSSSSSSPIVSHDRVKNVPLSTDELFLQRLGVTKPDGKPRKGMQSKLRQCQQFVQIVSGLINKAKTAEHGQQERSSDDTIKIIDCGCGRGYLTFSLHAFLCSTYGTSNVSTIGIDVRPKLVAEMNDIAEGLGEQFKSLTFEEGTIGDAVADAASTDESSEHEKYIDDDTLQVLVALHACDTATDDAIYTGIARGANVIVVAPCCHKQIRPQLDAHYVSNRNSHPLSDVLKHGIYRERHSETVTDSIRALLLELAGYKVQVFEFIGGEHTSKNVMLSAVKSRPSTKDKKLIRDQLISTASFHGIRDHKLARWMGVSLTMQDSEQPAVTPASQIRMPRVPKVSNKTRDTTTSVVNEEE